MKGAMMRPTGRRWRPLWAGGALVAVLALLGTALLAATPAAATPPRESVTDRGMVHSITLPDATPLAPEGPNRAQFQAYCRLCHSTRLPLTQPRMTQEKWAGVVTKMVNVYGAPIPAGQQPDIVAYLTAVRGTEPPPSTAK
jgi:cytochrome c5